MGSVSISVNPVAVVCALLALSATGLLWWLYAYVRWRLDVYVVQHAQQQPLRAAADSGSEDEEPAAEAHARPRRRRRG
jgi:hypothetical protein